MSAGTPAASIAQRAPTGGSVSPGRSSPRILAAASTEAGPELAAPLASSAPAVPAPRSSTLPLGPPPTSAGRPARSDEDRIRSTLSQFRTAYVQLNASAARAVWPSINEEALTRAFSDLRSQELRFDRCELDVNGSDALADCRGEATYIQRVGSQRPRTAQREWKFNLKKQDDGWTIASAQIR